jgi:putative ABC transport system permease protein
MRVSNRGVLRKLTARFLKASGARNSIAVAAIALTSLLFTSLFTIGGAMLGAIQEQTLRQVGTSAHGGLKYLTREQYEHFAASPSVYDISYSVFLASAENEALKKLQCEIGFAEDKEARWRFSFPTAGKMPQTENEVACSTIVLTALGVPREIGASVPLAFSVGDREYIDNFTLSGYWPGDRAMPAQQIWLPKARVDDLLAHNRGTISDDFAGKIYAELWFGNAFDIEGKMRALIAERGYTDDEIAYGVNWAYVASAPDIDPTTAAIVVLVLALILLSGCLMIYSVFAISINADIHFYGLLKTVGTTGKQIRRIVRGQALILSALGIPIGLLLGYVAGVRLTPAILDLTSIHEGVSVTASPPVFVFAAAFGLLTVFIGCRRPARLAARVSPVEAVRYSGLDAGGGRVGKRRARRTRRVTPLSMAWANVTRERRKLAVIVLSLSLAPVLLNSVAGATKGFDLDAYLSRSILSDFAVADSSVFGPETRDDKNLAGVTAAFLRAAAEQGAAEISNIYYRESAEPDGAAAAQVYGVGRSALENFTDIDYERLRSGDYAIVSRRVITMGESGTAVGVPEIGDLIALRDERGASRDFEVIGLTDAYPFCLSARFRFANSLDIILAEERFHDFFGETQPMQTNINAVDADAFEQWLSAYTSEEEPALAYISRATLKAEFDGLLRMYTALGGSLSFVLALIGVLNFINAIATSVVARRREFAVLQSVGMTGRQLRGTLFAEGVVYTALTAAFTLTAGLAFGRPVTRLIAGQLWFFKESFSLLPAILCLPVLLAVCAAAPLVCYAKLSRESVARRLRTE